MNKKTLYHIGYALCFLFAVACFSCCYAAPFRPYYLNHSEGWHWYREFKKIPKPTNQEKKETPSSTQTNPNQAMKNWQQQIKTALNLAILEPTVQNVQHYMQLQQMVAQQATLFTVAWQQALLRQPQLSHELQYPSTQLGQQVYWQQKENKAEQVLHKLSQSAGLFFFYHSGCHYCQRFAPVLKDFSHHTGIKVIGVSIDGTPLPEFPNSKHNPQLVQRLHITVTPSLYLAYPKTAEFIPVGHGLMSQSMLTERLVMLTQQHAKEQQHV